MDTNGSRGSRRRRVRREFLHEAPVRKRLTRHQEGRALARVRREAGLNREPSTYQDIFHKGNGTDGALCGGSCGRPISKWIQRLRRLAES